MEAGPRRRRLADPRLISGAGPGAVGTRPAGLLLRPRQPGCYLVAEQIMHALPVVPEWEPVLGQRARGVPRPSSTARDRASGRGARAAAAALAAELCRRTRAAAMLAATYAKRIGRAVAFSLAAFRQAFAGGRDLGDAGHGADRRRGLRDASRPPCSRRSSCARAVRRTLRERSERARAGRRAVAAGDRGARSGVLWRGGAGAGGGRPQDAPRGGRMKANRAYHLIVSRGGMEPAFLADHDRLDRIEVVSIDDGEVVLYWDLPAKRAARLLKELRADLAGLEADGVLRQVDGGRRRGPAVSDSPPAARPRSRSRRWPSGRWPGGRPSRGRRCPSWS